MSATSASRQIVQGVSLSIFDTSEKEQRFLLTHPSGRRWHVSKFLSLVVQGLLAGGSPDSIRREVSVAVGTEVTEHDVEQVVQGFLRKNHFLVHEKDGAVIAPAAPRPRATSFLVWKTPLLSRALLRRITPAGVPLFRSAVVPVLLLWAVLSPLLVWIVARPDLASFKLAASANPGVVMLLLVASYFLHELGHITACRAFGSEHGEVGFGIYMVFPVLYADTSSSWNLPRWQRAVIDLAGLYFQALFASVIGLLFLLTRQPCWMAACFAIMLTYAPNLNPFLKMDGYWFLSDLLGVPNLSRFGLRMMGEGLRVLNIYSLATRILVGAYVLFASSYMGGVLFLVGRFWITLVCGGYWHQVQDLLHLAWPLHDSSALRAVIFSSTLSVGTSTCVLLLFPYTLWNVAVRARKALAVKFAHHGVGL